jgi:hypothetical protein
VTGTYILVPPDIPSVPRCYAASSVSTLTTAPAGTVAEADADGELRIRGLDDQLGGWQPFTLPSG